MTSLPHATNPLTTRETECLRWASKGKTSWEIGNILGCTERTANYHIGNACSKMNVRGRQAAIALAILAGYLSDQVDPRPPKVAGPLQKLDLELT